MRLKLDNDRICSLYTKAGINLEDFSLCNMKSSSSTEDWFILLLELFLWWRCHSETFKYNNPTTRCGMAEVVRGTIVAFRGAPLESNRNFPDLTISRSFLFCVLTVLRRLKPRQQDQLLTIHPLSFERQGIAIYCMNLRSGLTPFMLSSSTSYSLGLC